MSTVYVLIKEDESLDLTTVEGVFHTHFGAEMERQVPPVLDLVKNKV